MFGTPEENTAWENHALEEKVQKLEKENLELRTCLASLGVTMINTEMGTYAVDRNKLAELYKPQKLNLKEKDV
jgi:hypothetical protein